MSSVVRSVLSIVRDSVRSCSRPGRRTRIKLRLLAIDPRCSYCKRDLDITTATLDHIYPKSHGGGNHRGNLTLCCSDCNRKKGSLII